jgi:hypothetical protein
LLISSFRTRPPLPMNCTRNLVNRSVGLMVRLIDFSSAWIARQGRRL